MEKVDFHHYTSEDSADQIIKTMTINESLDGGKDAMFGRGVYGTKLPPSAGKRAIASNNWAKGWHSRERRGHVDYVFKIQIPRSKIKEYKLPGRHIFLHTGKINLNSYSWEVCEVKRTQ